MTFVILLRKHHQVTSYYSFSISLPLNSKLLLIFGSKKILCLKLSGCGVTIETSLGGQKKLALLGPRFTLIVGFDEEFGSFTNRF